MRSLTPPADLADLLHQLDADPERVFTLWSRTEHPDLDADLDPCGVLLGYQHYQLLRRSLRDAQAPVTPPAPRRLRLVATTMEESP